MIRFLFSFVFSFLLTGCSQNERIPENVLPPKKMGAVLWDAMLADQTAEFHQQKDSSVNRLTRYAELYQQVFQIHKISRKDFERSLQFYESHPVLLKPILDSLQKKSEEITRNVKPVS